MNEYIKRNFENGFDNQLVRVQVLVVVSTLKSVLQ